MTQQLADISEGHVVVVPAAFWGHLRPLLHLSLNLLALHPALHLTLLLAPSVAPRVEKELRLFTSSPSPSQSPSPSPPNSPILEEQAAERQDVLRRVQSITCKSEGYVAPEVVTAGTLLSEEMDYEACMGDFLKRLYQIGGGQGFGAKPSFVVYDSLHLCVPATIKQVTEELKESMPPVIAFCPTNAAASWLIHAAEEDGGPYRRQFRLTLADAHRGLDPMEAAGKVCSRPLMAAMPMPNEMYMAFNHLHHAGFDPNVTGILVPSTAELENETRMTVEKVLGKKVYMTGPQFPKAVWDGVAPRHAHGPCDEKVFQFLDSMEAKHGARSVCYISFGSLFFPSLRPEIVIYLLQTLRQAGIPILFALPAGLAFVPQTVTQELEGMEECCYVEFAPQWAVLDHAATGFFVTHCGSNSTYEAILAEVPVVTMPFTFDQGTFAYMLTEKYHCGIDLTQVKTFANPDFTQLYDGSVVSGTEAAIRAEMTDAWKRMTGNDGAEMRKNIKELRVLVERSRGTGQSRRDMEALGRCYLGREQSVEKGKRG
ncbi:hypothetical protein IAT38_001881 [Cryptococcus sp. DSM 104549]